MGSMSGGIQRKITVLSSGRSEDDDRGFAFSESSGVREIILGRRDIRPYSRKLAAIIEVPTPLNSQKNSASSRASKKDVIRRPRANTFTYGRRFAQSVNNPHFIPSQGRASLFVPHTSHENSAECSTALISPATEENNDTNVEEERIDASQGSLNDDVNAQRAETGDIEVEDLENSCESSDEDSKADMPVNKKLTFEDDYK
jgi:hypothetical protein